MTLNEITLKKENVKFERFVIKIIYVVTRRPHLQRKLDCEIHEIQPKVC